MRSVHVFERVLEVLVVIIEPLLAEETLIRRNNFFLFMSNNLFPVVCFRRLGLRLNLIVEDGQ